MPLGHSNSLLFGSIANTAHRLKDSWDLCREGAYLRRSNLSVAMSQPDLRWRAQDESRDHDHLYAAVGWLKRAQDATKDGGVCGRYHLRSGWSRSYPETTGYIIPTFLQLAREFDDTDLRDRAQRAVDFLLPLQLSEGGFPAGEIESASADPSPFNTAQIMHGFQAWIELTGDLRCVAALRRAGEWLCAVQDADGAWRKHFYEGIAATYSAHLACWLAEAGALLGNDRLLEAASRHLGWVVKHFSDEHKWFDLCGFTREDHLERRSFTHTIAYTLWGVLRTSEVLGERQPRAMAEHAAFAVARRLELSRWLPGILDHTWKPVASYACLTGNVQMALIWLHCYQTNGDARLLNAALKSIDLAKAAQNLTDASEGIRGGIPGSAPIWGGYASHSLPNWAAKYFIDALLAKQRALQRPPAFPTRPEALPSDVPRTLPPQVPSATGKTPKTALLTRQYAGKPLDFLESWSRWNISPDLIIVEGVPVTQFWRRVAARLRRLSKLGAPSTSPAPRSAGSHMRPAADLTAWCRRHRIPLRRVTSVNSAAAVKLVHEFDIQVLIHAGAGILRDQIISAPALGVLNAHIGHLPAYRGMNVTEWSVWNGDPPGCSVHLIDAGIDTGDILVTRSVDVGMAPSIAHVRRSVNEAQIELLAEVLRYIATTGGLPPRRRQRQEDGLQYFTMHPALLGVLNERLARAYGTAKSLGLPTGAVESGDIKPSLLRCYEVG